MHLKLDYVLFICTWVITSQYYLNSWTVGWVGIMNEWIVRFMLNCIHFFDLKADWIFFSSSFQNYINSSHNDFARNINIFTDEKNKDDHGFFLMASSIFIHFIWERQTSSYVKSFSHLKIRFHSNSNFHFYFHFHFWMNGKQNVEEKNCFKQFDCVHSPKQSALLIELVGRRTIHLDSSPVERNFNRMCFFFHFILWS